MWARFTERARQVVYAAQEHARRLGLRDVSTEHLLIGLLDDLPNQQEANQAVQILASFGVNRESVFQELTAQTSEMASPETLPVHDMQLSDRAKRVIDFAFDEARILHSNYIGTEHLLLGILREPEGLGGATLRRLSVTLEGAQTWLHARKGDAGGDGKQNTIFAKAVASLRGLLRVPPTPQGREPIPDAKPQPAFGLEMSDAEIIQMQEMLARQDVKGYAETMRGAARVELPPDTQVEVLDHAAPIAEYWRKVRILSGDKAGKIVFVPLDHVRAAPNAANPADDAPLPDAPENRPRKFEELLRAALTVNSDAFDLTAGSPLILKNALTEEEIRAIVDEIITLPQRDAIERGEVVEAWCGLPQTAYNDHMEFNVDVYKIRGRLTARFRRAGT